MSRETADTLELGHTLNQLNIAANSLTPLPPEGILLPSNVHHNYGDLQMALLGKI
ncbi:hypothetical protein PtA15_6A76 [Puccinia triticina]|uniref:Uncharacterized protein n=1 Tax=Puccinia triticina TaxID=208348 RepID=A0ABY7CJN9_9BASI|nr:uncharacterized protein PtA15_6A76 [Puccinia triticina]WAQ85448.1 hypothetical protein PtA15_6A76 [Puccinia triticina]